MIAQPWLRTHLYKVLVLVVLALLLLQYAFSSIFEARQLEPLFAINSSVARSLRRLHGKLRDGGDAAAVPATPGAVGGNGTIIMATPADVFRNTSEVSDTVSSVDNTTLEVTTLVSGMPFCPPIPPNLEGPVKVQKEPLPLPEVDALFPMLEPGGHFRPKECQARYKVALVVPYRDRVHHLSVFLRNLHPMLQRQQLDYRIFVVEQAGNGAFNRAMLMNVGFVEALKLYDFDCFIFHDVDLLPEDDRNLYTCPEQPRHMSVAIDVFKYKLPYADIFGGVSAMTTAQFQKVNGFSNMFWGWGGEDDDMSNRIRFHGYHISRYPANIARYKMLTHRKQRANPKRYEYLNTGRKRFKSDGINSLHYQRKELKLHQAFTQVLAELATPS